MLPFLIMMPKTRHFSPIVRQHCVFCVCRTESSGLSNRECWWGKKHFRYIFRMHYDVSL